MGGRADREVPVELRVVEDHECLVDQVGGGVGRTGPVEATDGTGRRDGGPTTERPVVTRLPVVIRHSPSALWSMEGRGWIRTEKRWEKGWE